MKKKNCFWVFCIVMLFVSSFMVYSKGVSENWLNANSLQEAYKSYFDYFGLTVGYANGLSKAKVQQGLKHQVAYITMENEFKPDLMFNGKTPSAYKDFIAEDGNTYKVPDNMPDFTRVDDILSIAKKNDLKLRGHVLVWHSQTPEWFFKENYVASSDFVTPEEMNARMEWYIKTILLHVNEWEKANNNDERIIKIWDVVNEACSDTASELNWLRTDSNWYKIYKNETYIVNAFRYATKYAPAEVELVYNDYNSYAGADSKRNGKTSAILRIVDAIQNTPDARIDAVGMQAHVKINYPAVTGYGSFETAVQRFIEKGVNIQITEMDIANGNTTYEPEELKQKYKEYFTMFINNRKTSTKNGIESVTLWGVTDETSWLNFLAQYKGNPQHPLLFYGDYLCKPAFYGVIEAAEGK